MSALPLGMIIEGLVVVLLVTTIGYCILLNARLKRLRADEKILKATVAELVAATELAERAINSLKTTAGEADAALGQRLKVAEATADELARLIDAAERQRQRAAQTQAAEPAPAAARPQAVRSAGFGSRPAFAAARG